MASVLTIASDVVDKIQTSFAKNTSLQAQVAQNAAQALLSIGASAANSMACKETLAQKSKRFSLTSAKPCDVGLFNLDASTSEPGSRVSLTSIGAWGDYSVVMVESSVPFRPNNDKQKLVSNTITVEIRRKDLSVVDVRDSAEPIYISIPISETVDAAQRLNDKVCHFYNTTNMLWSRDGCNSTRNGDVVTCECNHLTDFGAFEIDSNQSNDSGNNNSAEKPPNQTTSLSILLIVTIGISSVIILTVASLYYLRRKRRLITRSTSVVSGRGSIRNMSLVSNRSMNDQFMVDAEQVGVIIACSEREDAATNEEQAKIEDEAEKYECDGQRSDSITIQDI